MDAPFLMADKPIIKVHPFIRLLLQVRIGTHLGLPRSLDHWTAAQHRQVQEAMADALNAFLPPTAGGVFYLDRLPE